MVTNATALSDAVLSEMLSFLYMDDLLALERVSHSWRWTLATARFWTHAQLEHQWFSSEHASTLVNLLAKRHGSQVKRLTLVGCVIPRGSLVKAAKSFSSLTHLTVSGCQTLADMDFSAIVQASTQQLFEVRAVKCLRLTDTALQAISAHHSQSLGRINFSYCRQISKDGVQAIARCCGNARSIKLKGCPAVTSSAVTCIAESCPKLETLLVGGAKNLTDDCLLALANHCPRLTTLDISRSNPFGFGRGGISDNALKYLACRCQQLEHLTLCGQGRLTLSVLSSLAISCPRLETLDICGCHDIISNPYALGAELKRMRGLHELSVAFGRGLKGEQIDFIASQCPQLKAFRVDGDNIVAAHA
ncbi:putative SCF E3 ubiquitin ligase complex F-box protein grrA [Phytophthora infestans]|uniref:Putative SCF E3 ubiquitin ligase complex F-box protein grrA n=1 Tax=Phytophthora infestans TaxID=4787 RepID=A0A833WEX4_PHYIN|nr:putative SCF E3 ubiquitin ligase complex F-box protein grrA [Phytophthora infestans]